MANNKSLVPAESVQFALTLPTKEEIAEVFRENMEGVTFQCERVKIPSGGGLAWEITDDDGNSDTTKELVGVIVDHHPANGFWAEKFSGKNQPPDCSSMDGVRGSSAHASDIPCASCPQNQFGSDPDGGAGKACKNMHRVYLLREDTVFPLLITLPPTSLGAMKDYVRRLTNKLKRLSGVVTKITLEKDKNEGGIQYSRAVFAKVGELSREEANKIAEHARALKPFLRQIGLTNDDYNTAEDNYSGTTIEVPADRSEQEQGREEAHGRMFAPAGDGDHGKAW